MTQLSAQQQAGIDKIKAWYTSAAPDLKGDGAWGADVFRLFGYAGSGKTTMAREIPDALGIHNVRYGTYTGKAAHVLRSKGAAPVSTIHSGIYMPTTSEEARKELLDARMNLLAARTSVDKATEAGAPQQILDELNERLAMGEAAIPELEANARRLCWEWDPGSDWAHADLIILDEVSMVNAKLAADIEAYGVPILVLGDPAQLPPVEGGGYYTNAKPDHLLTEIHRQALENPITELATRVRTSQDVTLGLNEDDMVPASMQAAMGADQVLVWTNKRRWLIVKAIRARLNRPENEVVAGDRIMCLTNNKDLAVFNGEQFEVLAAERTGANYRMTVRTEGGQERTLPVIGDAFLGRELQDQAKNSGAGMRGGWMLATFANAITVHKAQGSEWDSVYVANETPAMISMTRRSKGMTEAVDQGRQWLYTAVTRARERVTITAPRAN